MSRENFLLKATLVKGNAVHFMVSNITHMETKPKTDKTDAVTIVFSAGNPDGVEVKEPVVELIAKCASFGVMKEV